jgi:hypothetical protein
MNPRSFCPQCTKEWNLPWYDICPHCHYRFKGRPWWHAPSFIVFLICLPAIGITGFRLLTKFVPALAETSMEGVAFGIATVGVPVGAIAAAIILPLRMGKKGAAVLGWAVVWAVVFAAVSLALSFFSGVVTLG